MALYQLPTGTYETRAVFAFRGGSFRDKRQFAATAVLVRHPEGDLLIDAGFGAGVAAHLRAQPRLARSPYRVTSTAREQLDAGGYDLGRLRGVVLTHCHWDHVSGLDSLPVPVWITEAELRHAQERPDGAVFRTVAAGHELHRYDLDGPPYLGFPSSVDVYGDGSVVIVPAGGHTAGSVVVFVAVPGGRRYAFIGDLAWQLDSITRRVDRPLLMRALADVDAGRVRARLLHVISLAGLVDIVPAHDRTAYDGIPLLPRASA
jgi:glyoxylase-like metal-dependent hydrolase (beta-lactamase superfamily II)